MTEKRSGGGQRHRLGAAARIGSGCPGHQPDRHGAHLAQLGDEPGARSPRFWVGLGAAAYQAFWAGPALRPDYMKRELNGQIYSIHAPGLAALVLPAYAAAGYGGVVAFLCLLPRSPRWRSSTSPAPSPARERR